MERAFDRRKFIKGSVAAGLGLGVAGSLAASAAKAGAWAGKEIPGPLPGIGVAVKGKRVGVIGLDTSHALEVVKELNAAVPAQEYLGYRVVAAYPKGSLDIESSVRRIPGYTEEVKKLGVEIVDGVGALLEKVDVVMLETNDGRWHLEQGLQVMKAGKPVFIDKPLAASLADVFTIFEAAEHYKVPVFSASSLRYISGAAEINNGSIGKVLGVDAFSPANLERTHPDLFWYGVHGVEILYTIMGTGCKEVKRVSTTDTEFVVGTWADTRVGTFRGTRTGLHTYGGTVFGEKANAVLGPFGGYKPLFLEIIHFFETGRPPVSAAETQEIYVFMEAADESKRRNGQAVALDEIRVKAQKEARDKMKQWGN
ncbi:MAG TPA: Gfo/Idh/MocA family oxidoreductase [Puia sp.]|nr:Gfo/Idh/MocA family oxidoreductase [Puia sp.]